MPLEVQIPRLMEDQGGLTRADRSAVILVVLQHGPLRIPSCRKVTHHLRGVAHGQISIGVGRVKANIHALTELVIGAKLQHRSDISTCPCRVDLATNHNLAGRLTIVKRGTCRIC